MDEKQKKDIENVLTKVNTMRKYQKRFFGGDKAALKQAIYYENEADNAVKRLIIDYGLQITEPKGPSVQGSLM